LLLEKEILKGKSISLCFPKYRVYSSAIVGGSLPIALGTALSIKRNKRKNKVYCFIGDMTAETGIAHECIKYAINFNLPIHFVIEDNNQSVCTDTRKTWRQKKLTFEKYKNKKFITYYKYKNKYPHAGAGVRVQF
jgi:pyruvate dehydrogenase E1 component alpha subunit